MTHLTVDLLPTDTRLALTYATEHSAGVDLPAMIQEPLTLQPGERRKIGGGFKMHIRLGEGQLAAAIVAPRSGLGSKGLVIGNTIGLIDADYQGEVGLTLFNSGNEAITIAPGDRIMQMFFIPVLRAQFRVVDAFEETTARGEGGFGHTGT
jgi:dUTP pyrophosphatase